MISRIVKVNIEVAGYYKFMRSGGSKRQKFIKVMIRKVLSLTEYADEEGGRWILKTEILA